MKAFDLDLYNRLISEGKAPKIVTRDGRDVRILCTDRKHEGETIVALMNTGDGEGICTFYPCGSFLGEGEHENDLFFADPEPTYRPYKDRDECFRDALKHGGWVRQKSNGVYFHIIVVDDDEVNYTKHVSEAFKRFLEQNVWADDGSPCGVKEEQI